MAYSEDKKHKKRLVNFVGTLSTERLKEIKQALLIHLGD
jgi:mRNA-degrading endonuclease toxin of MazEF toxin-antitoxin module